MMDSFVDVLSDYALSLSEQGRQLFSPPLHWVLLANGDADFHDNVIFFGFDSRNEDPVLVAKVPRLPENGWMLKTEYDRLLDLWNSIGAEAAYYVPRPYGLTTLQERPALLISYISGQSLTRLPRRSFWGNSEQVLALAREAAGSLRDLHHLTERRIAPGESLRPDFSEKADKFRELFQLTSEEEQALSQLVMTTETHAANADHKILIQGDFWHGNMIRDEKQGILKFVDWQFARWSVDASLDVYFFLLAGALSATGEKAVGERAREAAWLLRQWDSNVIPEYLSVYGKPEHYALLPQSYGLLACCVEKAVRPALEFGYHHSDDMVWRNLFTELLRWQDEIELRD